MSGSVHSKKMDVRGKVQGGTHPGSHARPDRAVITFIGPTHLAGFGTLENILKEKASIAQGLTENGRLYVNGDQPELVEYVKTGLKPTRS